MVQRHTAVVCKAQLEQFVIGSRNRRWMFGNLAIWQKDCGKKTRRWRQASQEFVVAIA